jgi:hypothetical protein
MILKKKTKEEGALSVLNNDIFRIMTLLNNDQTVKKLLINTGKSPLQNSEEVEKDLRDFSICRVPLVPENTDEGSICVISLIKGDIIPEIATADATIAIDIFTPYDQWLIDEGMRPLLLADKIQSLIKTELIQTGGVKYRLSMIMYAQLTDTFLGYRLLFDTVLDD